MTVHIIDTMCSDCIHRPWLGIDAILDRCAANGISEKDVVRLVKRLYKKDITYQEGG